MNSSPQGRGRQILLRASVAPLTLLRLGVGLLFVAHGWVKLTNAAATTASFAAAGIPTPEVATYLAILGELGGGIGLTLGLLTRLAALGPALVTGSAIWFVHRGNGPFLENNGWEFALTMALVCLYFVFRGPGPVSVDALIAQMRRRSEVRAGRPPPPEPRAPRGAREPGFPDAYRGPPLPGS
ncbi:MAG TPA: DoxX family protein [Polyangiaceae bacterium]|nr:DoxX family protein [Polyangiaceae bacterium]